VENELCLTGNSVADFSTAMDKEVTGADTSVDPMALACAAPLVKLTLNGDIGLKLNVPVVCKQLFELVPTGSFCVWGYNGYKPVHFIK